MGVKSKNKELEQRLIDNIKSLILKHKSDYEDEWLNKDTINSMNINRLNSYFHDKIILEWLGDWIDNPTSENINKFKKLKPTLDILKSKYKKEFGLNTSKYKVVYRGTNIPEEKIIKFINLTNKLIECFVGIIL